VDFYEGSGADPGLDVVEVVQPFRNDEVWKDEDHGNGACSVFAFEAQPLQTPMC
jgi:hypothetical protein